MTETEAIETPLPPLAQLGYVVGDIEKACKYYESTLGIGPFSDVIDVNMDGALLRGESIETTIKVAFVQSGPVQIELIQPVSGANLYTEFLERRGDGIHHLGYQVESMEEMEALKAAYTKKVGGPAFTRDMGVMEFAYFDTSEVGGLMIEFLCFKNPAPTQ